MLNLLSNSKYYLIFSNSSGGGCANLLSEGFQHVSIAEKKNDFFILHEPLWRQLKTKVVDEDVEEWARRYSKEFNVRIIEVTMSKTEMFTEETPRLRLGIVSCVSVAAYIMRLTLPFFCSTPKSLYKHITSGRDKNQFSWRQI